MRKLLWVASLLILVYSCSESERDDSDTTVSSYEYARAENAFFDVWKSVHSVIVVDTVLSGQDTTYPIDNCFDSITRTPNLGPYPIELRLFYKAGGELCGDGRERSGTIIATLSGPYSDSGTVIDFAFENFTIDDQTITGTMQLVHEGFGTGFPRFTKTVTDAWLRRDAPGNQRQEIYFNSEQLVTWGIGNDTYNSILDDEFRATGKASGRNTFGNFFTTRITERMITNVQCVYESAGKVELSQNTLSTRFLDYGSACDDKIQVTFNGGSVEEITIP
jgi:hypothetical protein